MVLNNFQGSKYMIVCSGSLYVYDLAKTLVSSCDDRLAGCYGAMKRLCHYNRLTGWSWMEL